MPDIFVSYSRRDHEPVSKLVDLLVEQGWEVWWDQEIRPGQNFDNAIESVIAECRCVLVAWSSHSVQSEWVKTEAADGLERGCLIPVLLEPVDPPLAFRRKQAVDISDWRGGRNRKIDMLLEAVEAVLRDERVPGDHQHGTVARPPRRSPRLNWPAILLLLVAALGAGGYFAATWRTGGGSPAAQPAIVKPTLAILPFENRSPDPEDSYFSAGLHEEIIARMSRISNLSVFARTSMMQYLDTDKTVQQIGEELGARLILTGSVRFADNRVKVICELLDAATATLRWSEVYAFELADIFDVQASVAENVAQSIGLSTAESAPAMRAPTSNSAAYIAFMKGKYNGIRWKPDIAENYFREAIALDPDYAQAYAELAQLYYFRVDYYSLPAAVGIPVYVDLVGKAYELAPDNPNVMAKATLAFLHEGRRQDAESIRQRLMQGDFADPDAYITLAIYPAPTEEQIDLLERAIELDPLNAWAHNLHAWHLLRARRYEAALVAVEKAEELELNPSIFYLKGEILRYLGRQDDAQGAYERAIGIMEQRRKVSTFDAPSVLANLSYLYAKRGQRERAQQLVDELESLTSRRHVGPTQMVIAYAGLQDVEHTTRWLEAWYNDYGPWFPLSFVEEHPRFDFLRDNPEFQAFLTRIRSTVRQG